MRRETLARLLVGKFTLLFDARPQVEWSRAAPLPRALRRAWSHARGALGRHCLPGLLAAASACAPADGREEEAVPDAVVIDGSSTALPIVEHVAHALGTNEVEGRPLPPPVLVGVSGTRGGLAKLCSGWADIAMASRPMRESERERCAAAGIAVREFPLAYDGIAVVVHPSNAFVRSLTTRELRLLFAPSSQGKILRWRQVRQEWPDTPIHLYGAGSGSGTYDAFTRAIIGESRHSRGDYSASEDDHRLVQAMSSDPHALGFLGLPYFWQAEGRLRSVAIDDENPDNGEGAISPSLASVQSGAYQPLSRMLYAYATLSRGTSGPVLAVIEALLREGPVRMSALGYVPLREERYQDALATLRSAAMGRAFP